MIGRNRELAQLNRALTLVRPFLHRNPWLPSSVAAEQFAGMLGREPNPAALVAQVLRGEPNTADLCQLLASPLGQAALTALGFEFPQWRFVFQALPIAANAICEERRQQSNAVVGIGTLALVLALILYVVS